MRIVGSERTIVITKSDAISRPRQIRLLPQVGLGKEEIRGCRYEGELKRVYDLCKKECSTVGDQQQPCSGNKLVLIDFYRCDLFAEMQARYAEILRGNVAGSGADTGFGQVSATTTRTGPTLRVAGCSGWLSGWEMQDEIWVGSNWRQ